MKTILTAFIVLAVAGLICSILVHGSALLGIDQPFDLTSWVLHVGAMIVAIPAIFVSKRVSRDFKDRDFWKASLRGCPAWMRRMTYGFAAYAVVNFIIFFINGPDGPLPKDEPPPPSVLRGFSGHWMAFYCAAIAMMYSAIVVSDHDAARRCPGGHPVSPAARFCEECGARIQTSP